MSISSWTRGVVATASDPQARAHVVDACWLACGAGLLGCPTRESLDRLERMIQERRAAAGDPLRAKRKGAS